MWMELSVSARSFAVQYQLHTITLDRCVKLLGGCPVVSEREELRCPYSLHLLATPSDSTVRIISANSLQAQVRNASNEATRGD